MALPTERARGIALSREPAIKTLEEDVADGFAGVLAVLVAADDGVPQQNHPILSTLGQMRADGHCGRRSTADSDREQARKGKFAR